MNRLPFTKLAAKALEEGKISRIRYENYVNIYQELKEKRKW